MRRIAIIGGGIAGLTVALRRRAAGDQVVLFEAGTRLGGQLSSQRLGGFLIEHGAEGFVAGSAAVPRLAEAAGIADHIVEQLQQRSFSFDGTQLVELAPGEAARVLGFRVPSGELGRGIRSFRHGMAELPAQIALALAPHLEVRLHSAVRRVAWSAGGVQLLDAAGVTHAFDGAVVATTSSSAAELLHDGLGSTASALNDSQQLSSLTVTLGFRREAIRHPLDGSGFIVLDPEQLDSLRAVSFSSSKLPDRAPDNHALLRLFFRPSDRDLRELSDKAWTERAEAALSRALELLAPAEQAFVSRWPRALPVFDEAHRARIRALETALAPYPIWLAGAAFHGSGIDAAVRSGEDCARSISSKFEAR